MARASNLEREFDYYSRVNGLPPGEKEYAFAKSVGRRFRFDRAWPSERVAVELEGAVYSKGRHVRGKGFERDCEKYNLAVLLGWRVLRFTERLLRENPARCIGQVQSLLKGSETDND